MSADEIRIAQAKQYAEDMPSERERRREYRTVFLLVSALSNMCAATPDMVIDALTGLLWDEDEAGEIKKSATQQKSD